MLLEDLYRRLSYGELSNLALSNDGNGMIAEEAQPRIVIYANEALMRLHTKFVLKNNVVLITTMSHITTYPLRKRFAYSQRNTSTEPFYFIQDLDNDPFEEDVIKILDVYDMQGNHIPLNDPELYNSVFTPQATTLQVPASYETAELSLMYQAKHAHLHWQEPHALIDIPDVLIEALTAYIAYKVFSHMNTMEASSKAQEHLSVFNGICGEVVDNDLVSTSILQTNNRFAKRGWI